MNALFVTHEGIGNSIFRSQVLEHCADMRMYDVKFDILVYNGYRKLWTTSLRNHQVYQELYPGTIFLKKGLSIWTPFSFLYNAIHFIVFLKRNKFRYDYLHARTDYSAFISLLSYPVHRIPVIWDCRGDSLDEIKLAVSNAKTIVRMFAFYFVITQKMVLTFNKHFSKYIIFVSSSLQNLIMEGDISKRTLVVPCPVPEKLFFYSFDERLKIRRKLGILDGQSLFVYSGSMSGYQAVDFLIEFSQYLTQRGHKLLVLTTDIDLFNLKYRDRFDQNTVVVMKVGYAEIRSYYCAADFGVLLREERLTNWVASPTKFGEYCLTGLQVVHNETVQQVNDFTRILNNGVHPNSDVFINSSEACRIEIAELSKSLFGREFASKQYVQFYKSLKSNE